MSNKQIKLLELFSGIGGFAKGFKDAGYTITQHYYSEIECERLQGFPDDWTKYGNYNGTIKPIPKTARYKMCGNAVTVNVVKAIAERLTINN